MGPVETMSNWALLVHWLWPGLTVWTTQDSDTNWAVCRLTSCFPLHWNSWLSPAHQPWQSLRLFISLNRNMTKDLEFFYNTDSKGSMQDLQADYWAYFYSVLHINICTITSIFFPSTLLELTGSPVSSSNIMNDFPTLMKIYFLQIIPVLKQLRFSMIIEKLVTEELCKKIK